MSKRSRAASNLPAPPAPAAPGRTGILLLAIAAVGLANVIFLAVDGAHLAPSSVFLVLAGMVLVLTLYFLFRAGQSLVADPEDEVQRATGRRKKELEREKQSLMKALKEIEFDHEMRKISDHDRAEIAAIYRARAVRVMRQLDETGVDYRKLIEYDLAARRPLPGRSSSPAPVAAAPVQGTQEAPPVAPTGSAAPGAIARALCVSCGTDNDVDATFCRKCAAPIPRRSGS